MYRPSGQLSAERRQSSIENRQESSVDKGQYSSEERQLSGDSNGQSSVSEIGQNEQLSNEIMHTPKSTRKGQPTCKKSPSCAEKGIQFRNEFKTAVEGVRLKSKWETDPTIIDRKSGALCPVHKLFKYTHTNIMSKAAAVVELRNYTETTNQLVDSVLQGMHF